MTNFQDERELLAKLLDQLELELQLADLWQVTAPSAQALASSEPFAIDTLEPQAWLQWIFIARFRELLEMGAKLPSGFSIAPYYEQAWQGQTQYQSILLLLNDIDKVGQTC